MSTVSLRCEIESYLDQNWETIVSDIEKLVSIPSTADPATADVASGKPFGEAPALALESVLQIAADMGLETTNMDGYIGYADWKGETDTQLGIIGHVDVVPAGPGWTFEPFGITRKDGYLIGRGVIDDKGPTIIALNAVKFWMDRGMRFPYTVRVIFGASEETGMADVKYYRERQADPAFVITPDAEFPVCNGEKGLYDGLITSAPISDGCLIELSGGVASNAVPGLAEAVIRTNSTMPAAEGITISAETKIEAEGEAHGTGDGNNADGTQLIRITAYGKSAHASTPHLGTNAIGLLIQYLLEHAPLSETERDFLEADLRIIQRTDGASVGIDCEDDFFGPLTCCAGVIQLKGDRITQTIDCRWPTTTSAENITAALTAYAANVGATYEAWKAVEPFHVNAEHPAIKALLSAYNEITGEEARAFTAGGGTYAREFTTGASFGVEMPWLDEPEWVGSMHGPDEAVSEQQLKDAFAIYVLALRNIMDIEL